MQTQKPNQKDDQRKPNTKDVSGQSKNVNSKNESVSRRDLETDLDADRNASAKNKSKTSSTKDR